VIERAPGTSPLPGRARAAPAVVVALGTVDPALVLSTLEGHATFVADPQAGDLAVAEGAIVRADAVVDQDLLDRMPNLRVLARTGVGVDRVDVAAATIRGIAVVVTPGSGTQAVAEGVMAMALHLVKRLGPLTELVRSGRWGQRDDLTVGDLEGSTMGIVGYGRIGRRVASLAGVFGMHVLVHDLVVPPPDEVSSTDLHDLATRSDIITLHTPLDETTRHLVDHDFLASVKTDTLLINCGRGALVDLDAVLHAVADGRLSGVGLDVYESEPPIHHPVFDFPNVVLTPHLMGLSRRAMVATFAQAAVGIVDVLAGRRPTSLANPEVATAGGTLGHRHDSGT